MALYEEMQEIAQDILTEFGTQVTFTPRSAGTYDPSDSSTTNADGTTYTGYGHPSNYNKSEIDGELVRAEDIRLIVEKTSSKPVAGDKVAINSTTYRVLAVSEQNLQANSVIYICQCRK